MYLLPISPLSTYPPSSSYFPAPLSKGINLAYFNNINGKINFLSSLLLDSKEKQISFVDFDTVFSSYLQTKTLKFDSSDFSDFKIILPRVENIAKSLQRNTEYNILQFNCSN